MAKPRTKRHGYRRPVSEHFRPDGKPKVTYLSRRAAIAARNEMGMSDLQSTYQCTFCGAWHLGKRL